MLMDLLNKVATTALLGFVVSSMMAMGVRNTTTFSHLWTPP
jgi:hypothetical protein